MPDGFLQLVIWQIDFQRTYQSHHQVPHPSLVKLCSIHVINDFSSWMQTLGLRVLHQKFTVFIQILMLPNSIPKNSHPPNHLHPKMSPVGFFPCAAMKNPPVCVGGSGAHKGESGEERVQSQAAFCFSLCDPHHRKALSKTLSWLIHTISSPICQGPHYSIFQWRKWRLIKVKEPLPKSQRQ